MKIQFLLNALFILSGLMLNAQWYQQSSSTSHNLNDIYFINPDTGWIVGNAGTLLNTYDAGTNWNLNTISGYPKLTAIDFADDSTGYISCFDGYILKTTNVGIDWELIYTGFPVDLEDIQAKEEGKIWACGDDKILFSGNGGMTWMSEFQIPGNFNILSVPDTAFRWAIQDNGNQNLYRKISSNPTWELNYIWWVDLFWAEVSSLFFTNPENGWVLRNWDLFNHGGFHLGSDLYYTGNLGDSLEIKYSWDWIEYGFSYNNYMWLSDLYFVYDTLGWTVGGNGYIFKTENAGCDWDWQFSGTEEDLNCVFFTDSLNGWIAGANGIILHTYNAGGISCFCLPEGLHLTTQAKVDSFQINHPYCKEIVGELVINGDDIDNLNGLNNITSVGEYVTVKNNDILTSLSGLDSLIFIGENLDISGNPVLASLTGLENITQIPGNLTIGGRNNLNCNGNSQLSDLNGLNNLNSIGGNFLVYCNDALIDFSGLESLNTIGGNLEVGKLFKNNFGTLLAGNPVLINFTGLNSLTSINGDINISYNESLTSLSGLENIDPVSIENLAIHHNISLSNCEVESLCDYLANPNGSIDIYNNAAGCNSPPEIAAACGSTIPCLPYGNFHFCSQSDIDNFHSNYPNCFDLGGNMIISGDDISNLVGLSIVTSIGGNLQIINNDMLTELTGLDNIEPASIENLKITENDSLSLCHIDNICHYLLDPGGSISIANNATGCFNQNQVMQACGLTPCLPDGIAFTTQNQVDSFYYNYPNCPVIGGNITIQGDDISNLNGLHSLRTIEGDLRIKFNNNLTDISGLGNLTKVGGTLLIYFNYSLTNLAGLDSLIQIGDNLEIYTNPNLSSLSGLESLTIIGNNLKIVDNNSLNDLMALTNLSANTFAYLQITSNDNLSACQVESICDYLLNNNGTASIKNNAPGCNSQQEVEDACNSIQTNIPLSSDDDNFTIIPNPLGLSSFITYTLRDNSHVTLEILDLSGRSIEHLVNENQQQGKQQVIFNTEGLKPGIYFCTLKTSDGMQTRKIIKL
ncbi:MAG: T9SS type A sorting domain-containing protein [Bacteroidetes bacterium]|nr:T9SS type A sorting domain-containing protein [Bacteroidota bacterium]